MINDIEYHLLRPQRKLVVSSKDINMSYPLENKLFFFMVDESKGSAGGRGGGSGHRKITRVMGFEFSDISNINKVFDTNQDEIIEKFEIPYSAVAIDIILSNGTSYVAQGIVDPQLIEDYWKIISHIQKADKQD